MAEIQYHRKAACSFEGEGARHGVESRLVLAVLEPLRGLPAKLMRPDAARAG